MFPDFRYQGLGKLTNNMTSEPENVLQSIQDTYLWIFNRTSLQQRCYFCYSQPAIHRKITPIIPSHDTLWLPSFLWSSTDTRWPSKYSRANQLSWIKNFEHHSILFAYRFFKSIREKTRNIKSVSFWWSRTNRTICQTKKELSIWDHH